LRYTLNDFDLGLGWQYVGSTVDTSRFFKSNDVAVPHKDYFDIDAGYSFHYGGWLDGVTLRAGIENLTTNRRPYFHSGPMQTPTVAVRRAGSTLLRHDGAEVLKLRVSGLAGSVADRCEVICDLRHHALVCKQAGEGGAAIPPVLPDVVRPVFDLGALGSRGVQSEGLEQEFLFPFRRAFDNGGRVVSLPEPCERVGFAGVRALSIPDPCLFR
jgi:hypothetical protein